MANRLPLDDAAIGRAFHSYSVVPADKQTRARCLRPETMGKNFTIGQKLAGSFGIVIVLAGLLSYSSLVTVSLVGRKAGRRGER